MNCCDEYGNCNQGRDCPVRRVKAGQPAPSEWPPKEFWPQDDTPMQTAAKLVAVCLVVAALLFFALGFASRWLA